VGLTIEELDKMADRMSTENFDRELRQRARKITTTIPDFIKEMDESGVRWGMIRVNTNEQTAATVKLYPERFMGVAIANPHKGMKAVRDLEVAIKELGLKR
jgi:predicted TIM-barrel fold metal-dependent hydrolase